MDMGVMRRLKKAVTTTLRSSKQWHALQKIDPSMPSTKYRKMQADMTKGQAALSIQLRTGHAPLNRQLHRMKLIDSPVCTGCNRAHETVKHYLLDCPKTSCLRAKISDALGREARSLKTLLSHPKALKAVLIFIGRTGRFGEAYGTMVLPEPKPKKRKRREKQS